MTRFSLFGLLAALLVLLPGLAAAQNPGAAEQRAPSVVVPKVNPTELSQFAAAYGDVTKIRKTLMIKTHGLTNEEKIAALKAQAQKKMKQAIEAYMTLSEYVRVGNAVNANPALHARFMHMRHSSQSPPTASTAG